MKRKLLVALAGVLLVIGLLERRALAQVGSAALQTVIAIQTTAANLNAQVVGSVASDSADAGNPVKIGGKAFSFGTGPTAVTASDRVDASFNREGALFVLPGTPTSTVREYMWTTAQTNDAVITVSSGTRIGVTGFQFTLDEATTVGVGIRCGFGTSTLTTAPTDGNGADNTFLHHVGAVPGGGVNSPPGMLAIGADDEDVRCTTEATTSGTGKLFVYYFTTAN